MSCTQVIAFPTLAFRGHKPPRYTSAYLGATLPMISKKLASTTCRYRQVAPICLFGGKGESQNADKASPWKALENALGNFKKDQSIEDVLKQQIQKQEYYDDGGGKPPRGSGGDGSGDADEDGESAWDEFVQVILATVGFIFLYIYIIEAEEVTVLAKDMIKFLFTRQMSLRISRIINNWKRFFEMMNEEEEYDPYWLERAIVNTPTMYDSPEKYKRIIYKSYLDYKSGEGNNTFE